MPISLLSEDHLDDSLEDDRLFSVVAYNIPSMSTATNTGSDVLPDSIGFPSPQWFYIGNKSQHILF